MFHVQFHTDSNEENDYISTARDANAAFLPPLSSSCILFSIVPLNTGSLNNHGNMVEKGLRH